MIVNVLDSHGQCKNPKLDVVFVVCGRKFCLTTMKLTAPCTSLSLSLSLCPSFPQTTLRFVSHRTYNKTHTFEYTIQIKENVSE